METEGIFVSVWCMCLVWEFKTAVVGRLCMQLQCKMSLSLLQNDSFLSSTKDLIYDLDT